MDLITNPEYEHLVEQGGIDVPLPCAVITSSCNAISPERIIKDITGLETLPLPVFYTDGVRGFPWHIDTKYYEADISLCAMDKKTLGNQEFANSVNAVIICFDSNSNDGLTVVEQWFTFTKEFQADVQILLCDQCKSEPLGGISKVSAQQWCVKHGFELVELNPEECEDIDVEDDFPESLGITRVVQALHAHLWPNLTLKESRERVTPHAGLQNVLNGMGLMGLNPRTYLSNEETSFNDKTQYGTTGNSYAVDHTITSPLSSDHQDFQCKSTASKIVAAVKPIVKSEPESPSTATLNVKQGPTFDIAANGAGASVNCHSLVGVEPSASDSTAIAPSINHGPRNEKIDSMLQAMDSMSEDSFEELFQNLNEMKTKAQNLSPNQRKSYAEQMAVAFWRSLGGNESEIDGLSSEEES